MRNLHERRDGEVIGTLHRFVRLAGRTLLIIKIVVKEKPMPAMTFRQVVPFQGTECARVQPVMTSCAQVVRLVRVIARLDGLNRGFFTSFAKFRHGKTSDVQYPSSRTAREKTIRKTDVSP